VLDSGGSNPFGRTLCLVAGNAYSGSIPRMENRPRLELVRRYPQEGSTPSARHTFCRVDWLVARGCLIYIFKDGSDSLTRYFGKWCNGPSGCRSHIVSGSLQRSPGRLTASGKHGGRGTASSGSIPDFPTNN
jgi:hypothetical protein